MFVSWADETTTDPFHGEYILHYERDENYSNAD